jgi:abortive infection bacteriophage resistance protein
VKPFKELSKLVDLLVERGLDVDTDGAVSFLHDCNYYRFTGYSRQFQVNPGKQDNDYLPGSTLSDIRSKMALDSQLRGLLGSALSSVEISVRARFAHESGRVLGDDAFYLRPESYLPSTPKLDRFIEGMRDDLRRTTSRTVARYVNDESFDKVPIWVAVEVLSFGSIARMIQYLANDLPAKTVAGSYSLPWEGFQSTIHSFSVLRNRCAHHGQIWHRRLDIQCPVPRKLRPREPGYDPQGPYAAAVMLRRYLKEIESIRDWGDEVDALLESDEAFRAGILKPFAK